MTQHTPSKAKPGEFPLGSVESRATARRLLESQHSADDWKTVRVEVDSVEEGKRLARLFSNAGSRARCGAMRLINTETGREIPF